MTAPRSERRRERAIAALLAEARLARAAASAGVSERTLRRWLQDPSFAGAFREARRQALDVAVAALQEATGEAVSTLRRSMAPTEPPGVQLRAALGVLEHAARLGETLDLIERVAALEARERLEGRPQW